MANQNAKCPVCDGATPSEVCLSGETMTEKTGTELMMSGEYVRTRGTAAAHEAGCRTPAEIAAFHAGAEWMGDQIRNAFVLTPRTTLAEVEALLKTLPSQRASE